MDKLVIIKYSSSGKKWWKHTLINGCSVEIMVPDIANAQMLKIYFIIHVEKY